jgi:hypothetical protein
MFPLLFAGAGCLVSGMISARVARWTGSVGLARVAGFSTPGACMDVGGEFGGTLSGSTNRMGNLGSMVSPLAMGDILNSTGDHWNICLCTVAADGPGDPAR